MRVDDERAAAWLAEGEKLSAHAISGQVGKSARVIQGWFGDGLPHVTETRRGQAARLTTLRALREWCKLKGYRLEAARPSGVAERAEAAREERAGGPLLARAETDFEARVEAEVARRLESLVGDPAYDERIVRFRRLLALMFRIPEAQIFEAAEQQQASQALKNASAELRQLEKWAMEQREARGELIEKGVVLRTLSGLADVIASARDSIPPDLARTISDAVAREVRSIEGVPETVPDRAARAALAAAEIEVAKAFAKIAEAVKVETSRGYERADETHRPEACATGSGGDA